MPTFTNPLQYGSQAFDWDPSQRIFSSGIQENAPGYLPELLAYRDRQRQGQTQPWEAEQYTRWEEQARAIPTRDIASLTSGWQGESQGLWTDEGWQEPARDWWTRLDPGSPDAGPIMLGIRDKMDAGTATAQERALFEQTMAMAHDWNYRASVPQASDANPFGMGDQFMQALTMLTAATGGAGAFGAFGAGAGAAGAGAGAAGAASASPSVLGIPTSTLSTVGAIGGYGSQAANVLGGATGQDWLSQIGRALSVASGLAGGVAGLGNVASSGVTSLSDAARLASAAGKLTGAGGLASGYGPLQQAASYLGRVGQLGSVGAGLLPTSATDWSGTSAPLGSAQGPGMPGLLSAADMATQRGGGNMSEWDWTDYGGGDFPGDYSTQVGAGTWGSSSTPDYWGTGDFPGDVTGAMTSAQQAAIQSELNTMMRDPAVGGFGSGGGGFWGTLGSLGSGALKMLLGSAGGGTGGGALGPLLSALGSVRGGAIGSNAANEAAGLQAAALNRGIDLQTAQWLQQQQNLAPYLQAGQGGLSQLQQLAGRQAPALPGATPAVNAANYNASLPDLMPGWRPQAYQGPQGPDAGAYRWNPQQGPQATDFRYQPGAIPQASQYRYTPGAVPTLSGKELLANDPGVQFRQDEARKALEGSAAARGDLLSGGNLKALQSRSQDLASQEYGNAFARASQQAQLREQWGQAASQMGWGQAEAESRLREQVNQIASSQGWTQAQAEAAFREGLAQQSSQQGWQQALQGQQNAFGQGLQTQQWNQEQQKQFSDEIYRRMLAQNQLLYGRDVSQNEQDYARQQAAYRQQLAQHLLPWEQASTLANLGGQAVSMYGSQGGQASRGISDLLAQLGSAQGTGAAGSGLMWNRALTGAANQVPSLLASLNA